MSPAKCSSNILYINVGMVQKFKYITMCFELLKKHLPVLLKKINIVWKKIKKSILFLHNNIQEVDRKKNENNFTVYLM